MTVPDPALLTILTTLAAAFPLAARWHRRHQKPRNYNHERGEGT